MDVAIDGIDITPGHRLGHTLEHRVRGVEVIGVEDAYHIARGTGNALVHRVIYASVRLARPMQPPAEARLIASHDVHRVVARCSIDDDQLDVAVCLSQDTLKRVTYRPPAVVSGGDDRYSHIVML